MNIIEVEDIGIPELVSYVGLSDRQLRNRPEGGTIIVESPKVILTAMESGCKPLSLLCERKHIYGDAAEILNRSQGLTVYTGSREKLESLTGYTLTRGVLCEMRRPASSDPEEILRKARRVCVIYDVCDSTNIGVIFRTAAALGVDAVVLTSESCDPFNRRAIRVSMGAVFRIPWCMHRDIIGLLRGQGFETISMALTPDSVYLQDFHVESHKKYAVFLGSEGYGLPEFVIQETDHVVKIPMENNIDSLNVGAAAAITLWHIRK